MPLERFSPIADQSELERLFEVIESRDSELAGLLGRRLTERAEHRVTAFPQGTY